MQKTKIIKINSLVNAFDSNTLLIYDKVLLKQGGKFISWRDSFRLHLGFRAGEQLKDLELFANNINRVLKKVVGLNAGEITILAVGGGSVGDFCGFVATVLKRGVKLVHMPSTWLSAIDSAHGGKTALNVMPFKNQIGSFYPASAVYFCKSLLYSQPELLAREAQAELYKIALITGGDFWNDLQKSKSKGCNKLWKFLEIAVQSKTKVVNKDPFEQKNIRQVLNLGHTYGHFYESYYQKSHGEGVEQGLFFALSWSAGLGLLSQTSKDQITNTLLKSGMKVRKQKPASRIDFVNIVKQDKKMQNRTKINFVFIKSPGVIEVKTIRVASFVKEAQRQGLLR